MIVGLALLLAISCIAAAEVFAPTDRLVATRTVRLLFATPMLAMLVGVLALLGIPGFSRRENQRPPLEAARHARQLLLACTTIAAVAIGPYIIFLVGFRPNPLALLPLFAVPAVACFLLLLSQSRTGSARGLRDSPRCANCQHPIRGSIFSPCSECGWTGRRTD